jgi:hypothetical protein
VMGVSRVPGGLLGRRGVEYMLGLNIWAACFHWSLSSRVESSCSGAVEVTGFVFCFMFGVIQDGAGVGSERGDNRCYN